MINAAIKKSIEKSVLCWLATSSLEHVPNVSPKEVFMAYDDESIIIANIASPQTVKNILENPNVCISFIDIFIQKGYQLKGRADLVREDNREYENMKRKLEEMTMGKFPFRSITKIKIEKVKEIIAPSYMFYPETKEEDKIADAKESYLKLIDF